MVYGSTEEVATSLRTFKDGQLLGQEDSVGGYSTGYSDVMVTGELCQESCWRLPPAESAPPLCTSASGQGTIYKYY